MKKIFAIAMAFAFVAVSTVAFAQEKKAETVAPAAAPAAEKKAEHPGEPAKAEKKEEKKAAKAHTVTGAVKAVDAKANTLTVVKKVKKEEKEVVLTCTDKTKFKGVKGLADVKAGDKVTAKYSEKDGKNEASSVEVKAAPAKKGRRRPRRRKPLLPRRRRRRRPLQRLLRLLPRSNASPQVDRGSPG